MFENKQTYEREGGVRLPIEKRKGSFTAKLTENQVAGRPGEYVLILRDEKKPSETIEVALSNTGEILELRNYTQRKGSTSVGYIRDEEEIKKKVREFLKEFPMLSEE